MNAAESRAEYVRRLVADFPPLTPEQIQRVAALLAPTATAPVTRDPRGGGHG